MWRHTAKPQTISVLFDHDTLTLAWIRKRDTLPFLGAYKKITWTTDEFYQGVMYNIAFIQSCINDFITAYGIRNPHLALCITGNTIRQTFYTSHNITMQESMGDIPARHSNQRHYYIGPSQDHNLHWHYTCSFAQEHLLQYLLLGIRVQAPIVACTTTTMAYISLYKKMHATSFRHTQLSLDLERHLHQAELLFSVDIIYKMIITGHHAINMNDEYTSIGRALGLFYLGV